VSIINDVAFEGCTSLASVYISDTKAISLGVQRVPSQSWRSPSQTPHITNFYGAPSTIRFFIPSP
jgi:hypothetical protein